MLKKLVALLFVLTLLLFTSLLEAKTISLRKNNLKIMLSVGNNSQFDFYQQQKARDTHLQHGQLVKFNIGSKTNPFVINSVISSNPLQLQSISLAMSGFQTSLLENPSRVTALNNDYINGYYVYGIDKLLSRTNNHRMFKIYARFNYSKRYYVSVEATTSRANEIAQLLKIISSIKIVNVSEYASKHHSNELKTFIKNLELLKIKHEPSNYNYKQLKKNLANSAKNINFLSAVDQAVYKKNFMPVELSWYKASSPIKRLIILSYFITYSKDNLPDFERNFALFNKEQAFYRDKELKFIKENQEMIALVLKETHKKKMRKTLKAILDPVQYLDNEGNIKNELRLFQMDSPKYSGIKINKDDMPLFAVIFENFYKKERSLFVELECRLEDNYQEINEDPTADANFIAKGIRIIDYKSIDKHKFPSILKIKVNK
ncbi:hypothetical protein AAEX28_10050 [Lentisphaerota bacterium WC36G]|nr:hypothetical protein LJT99_12885 [Lentisphaerae bacterium WC36]